jgi:hypothetical protein
MPVFVVGAGVGAGADVTGTTMRHDAHWTMVSCRREIQ